jgi:Trypsin-like peptidase domain
MHLAFALCLSVTLFAPQISEAADRTDNSGAWIATARIMRNGAPSGSGVYLKSGLVITAAHLTDANAAMGVHLAGVNLPAKVLKQGSFDDEDLSLLLFDEGQVPTRAVLPQTPLCAAPPWPGDPVIVVDAASATRSHIASPQLLPFTLRGKFSTLISDVATTGNSGSGVFDPDRKCLLGIMSRKFTSNVTGTNKDIAKYFVPAATIREFIPAEFNPLK